MPQESDVGCRRWNVADKAMVDVSHQHPTAIPRAGLKRILQPLEDLVGILVHPVNHVSWNVPLVL